MEPSHGQWAAGPQVEGGQAAPLTELPKTCLTHSQKTLSVWYIDSQ